MKPRVWPDGPMTPELLLEAFGEPLSFHRCLVPITGSVLSALFLSQAIRASESLDPRHGGWFARSRERWTEVTGLSRFEQETARRRLRSAGLLQERRIGVPATLWYRVDADRVWTALQDFAETMEQQR